MGAHHIITTGVKCEIGLLILTTLCHFKESYHVYIPC